MFSFSALYIGCTQNKREMTTIDRSGNIYSIISDYISGKITDADLERLRIWMEESEDNRRQFVEISAIVSAAEILSENTLQQKQDEMLKRLNMRIDADEAAILPMGKMSGKKKFWKHLSYLVPVAAAIAVFCLILIGRAGADREQDFLVYSNTSRDIIAVMLQDSTKVWLAQGGSIRYRHHDSRTEERTASLTGNAFFDVHADSLHPFIVRTDNIAVKVLGTAFAVECDGDRTSVLLERGSVRLQTPDGVNLVRLHPDQVAVYDAGSHDMEVSSMKVSSHIVNTYNKVVLNNASIYDIISHINNIYETEITLENATDTIKRYNLRYRKSDSLKEVIDIVETLTGAKCLIP